MKGQRHIKIREIITQQDIETQDELVEALRAMRFQVTQATVSPGHQRAAADQSADGRRKIQIFAPDRPALQSAPKAETGSRGQLRPYRLHQQFGGHEMFARHGERDCGFTRQHGMEPDHGHDLRRRYDLDDLPHQRRQRKLGRIDHELYFIRETGQYLWGIESMLLTLSIRNLAVIESVDVSFHAGFHVLSGETGAGNRLSSMRWGSSRAAGVRPS